MKTRHILAYLAFMSLGLCFFYPFQQVQAQCSGTMTMNNNTCQVRVLGDGTPGFVRVCITTNNIGSSNCNPGGSCNPPFNGGGWSPRIAIFNSNGTTYTGAALSNFANGTPTGTCFTVSAPNGYAYVMGVCPGNNTTITWSTINTCGDNVCTGTAPPCAGPPCETCSSACPACGFTTTPAVQDVVDNCPDFPYTPPLAGGSTATRCASFTAINTTVSFNVIISSTGCSGGNVTNLTWTLHNSTCGAAIQSGTLSGLSFNNLTIGQSYTFCYTFTAACQHNTHRPFFVGAAPLVLSNSLTAFQAILEPKFNILEWQMELANSDFVVQRSSDGFNFEDLASLGYEQGERNDKGQFIYRYFDARLLPQAYYRLKIRNREEGEVTFSAIRHLERSELVQHEGLRLLNSYPVPLKGQLNLDLNASSASLASVKVFNSLGQEVYSQQTAIEQGINKLSIPINDWPSGLYTLSIRDEAGRIQVIEKLLK